MTTVRAYEPRDAAWAPDTVDLTAWNERRLGAATLHTHASRTARPAFERFGFVVDGENPENRIRGQNLPNYDLHLDLG